MCAMALKYPSIFTCWWRILLIANSKFDLLAIKRYNVTRKHLFLYPKRYRSDLRKPKKITINTNHSHLQHSSPYASLNRSNNKIKFSVNQPSRKRWGTRLVVVIKHSPYKTVSPWQFLFEYCSFHFEEKEERYIREMSVKQNLHI